MGRWGQCHFKTSKVQIMAKTLAISFSMKSYFITNTEELSTSLGICLFVFSYFPSNTSTKGTGLPEEIRTTHFTKQAPDKPGTPSSQAGWGTTMLGLLFPMGSFLTCPTPTGSFDGIRSSEDKHVTQYQHLLRKHGLVKAFNQFL